MSNYSPTTIFADKDLLPTNNPAKIIKGSEFGAEFTAISTMSGTKADLASPTFTGTVTIPTATITTANVSGNVDVVGDLTTDGNVGIGIDAPVKPLHVYNATTDVVARLESGDATAGVELVDSTSTAIFKVNSGLLTIGTDSGAEVADSNISIRVDNVEKANISDVLTILKQPTRINDNQGLSFGNTNDLTISHLTGTNVNTVQNSNNRALLFNGVSFVFQNQNADEKLIEMTANGAVDLYHNNNKKLGTTSTGIEVTGDVDMPDNSKVLIGDDDNLQLYYDGTDSLIEDTNSGNLIMRGVQLKLQSYAAGNEDYITCTNNGPVALFNNGVQKANTFGFGFQVAGRLEVDTPSTNADETVLFKKDGTTCGGLRTTAGQFPSIAIGSADTGIIFQNSSLSDSIRPWDITGNQNRSGAIDLGASGAFWDDIYALNGTINTSDANEKQSIEELTEAETRVARACKGLVRKFKWNSAVEKKGSEARYHFGVVAQDVQAAFEAEGLDAGDYGLFVSNTEEDEDGVEQTRLGVRYTELLAFIIGGLV